MPFLSEALLFLGAAVTVVPALKRLGLSSVLGYLGAGLLIGQAGLGLVQDPAAVLQFAEIGVVLLLFIIGLELQPRRLWVMRRLVFGLGTLQVVVTTAAIGALLLVAGQPLGAAALLGFALALSSTAFVLQLLAERQKLAHLHGRAAFGTLLLQDVAVIPAIAVVNLLAAGSPNTAATPRPWLAVAVIAGAVLLRFLLRPLLRFVAASGIRELFTAASLALVAGAALAMGEAGLSMGFGAFVAGLMVADSAYRHQLETDVDPFKGLLLGLFFMAVGMTVDLGLLLAHPIRMLALTAALMAVKALVIVPLARFMGLGWRDATRTGAALAQGGEFAFVLLGAALAAQLVSAEAADTAVLVVTLSMVATPLLVAASDRLLDRGERVERPFDTMEPQHPRVVVAGFGRVGQIVARVLAMRRIPFTALEINPHHVDFVRSYGNQVYYGDATRLDVLRSAGVPLADALVVAVSNVDASLKIVERVRATCPRVAILARATNRDHELQLRELGVDYVLRDTLQSSLRLACELLARLGLPADAAADAVARFEAHDALTLQRQAAVFRDAEAMRRTTMSAREELAALFAADVSVEPDPGPAPGSGEAT